MSSFKLNPLAAEFVPKKGPFDGILSEGETVYIIAVIGKRDNGSPLYTAATCVYAHRAFTITACKHVPSMIGMSSENTEELLRSFYKGLMDAQLLSSNAMIPKLITKQFTVAREGKMYTLYKLLGF